MEDEAPGKHGVGDGRVGMREAAYEETRLGVEWVGGRGETGNEWEGRKMCCEWRVEKMEGD